MAKFDRVIEKMESFNGVTEFEVVHIYTWVIKKFIDDEISLTSFKLYLFLSTTSENVRSNLTPISIIKNNWMCGNYTSIKKSFKELLDKKLIYLKEDTYFINHNTNRINENGVKFNPKIYFSCSYLKAFLMSSVMTERMSRFMCIILMHIQAVPTKDSKIFKAQIFINYLTAYSYYKSVIILEETLEKLEVNNFIKILGKDDKNSYEIRLTNYLNEETIDKIHTILNSKYNRTEVNKYSPKPEVKMTPKQKPTSKPAPVVEAPKQKPLDEINAENRKEFKDTVNKIIPKKTLDQWISEREAKDNEIEFLMDKMDVIREDHPEYSTYRTKFLQTKNEIKKIDYQISLIEEKRS